MNLLPFIATVLILFVFVLLIADRILKAGNKILDRNAGKETSHWKFLADENFPDEWGANSAGVLTDGTHFLYWHALKDNENDPVETCHIYNSIYMTEDTEEIYYPWTAENDALVIAALNASNEQNDNHWCGDDSALRQIEFKPETL